MSQNRTQEGKITDIQVLRGICILMVLFQHMSISATIFAKFPRQINLPFYLGVELFFVISGYVVTMSLKKDDFNGIKFLIKRVFRLIPAILLFLSFSYLVMSYVRQSTIVPEALKPLFVVNNSVFFEQAQGIVAGYFITLKSPAFYMNGAMWSLSVEDQFYAGIAAISLLAMVSRRLTRIPAKWWVIAASLGLFAVLFRMRYQSLMGRDPFAGKPAILAYLLHWKFDFLPLGVLLAMFDISFPGFFARRLRTNGPALTGYLLMVPLAVMAICESPFGGEARFQTGVGLPLTALCFGFLVLLAGNQCAFPQPHGRVYKVLEYFGNRSYTIYLFHFPMMVVAWVIIFRWIPSSLTTPTRYGLTQLAVVSLLLAPIVELIYRLVEVPLTRLGKRLVDGRRVKPETSANPETLPMTRPVESAPGRAAA